MDGGARVTTTIVGLLIAFCALLLAKWLAVVAIAAVVLLALLRFVLLRLVRAVRARREARTPAAALEASPSTPGGSAAGSSLRSVAGSAAHGDARAIPGRAARGLSGASAAVSHADAGPCSWCGLVGGHLDLRGRPVRPRHAHAGTLTRR
ncbi:hypothetical protein PHK61_20705 [Actinomycetospora lutea]|uniref:hypothetical protein n=1 Tax=Actinomycetospora lutea TaxID=663604 RepID=UPI002365AF72|nr:hypothetical protein [Actinomycetospora lutea]MDD7940847.1 hypothetical protein [Actinomycetospora lutea]